MVRNKSLFTLILCLLLALEAIAQETILDEYLKVNNKIVTLIFLRTDECLGCDKNVMRCFNLLNAKIDSDVYAIVNARRQIELKKFSKLFRWKKNTILFKEEMLKKFDIKKDCLVVVFDPGGKKLGEVSRYDKNAYYKLIKIYKGAKK